MYFLIILFMPILILAQNVSYQDTIIAYNGKTYPCYVRNLDDSKVNFIYSKNVNESIVLYGLHRLIIDSLGTVYSSENKFLVEPDIINSFLKTRNEKNRRKREAEKKRAEAIEKINNLNLEDENISEKRETIDENNIVPRWSFGFNYVPYFLGETYSIRTGGFYDSQIYSFPESKIMMESQLSYLVEGNLRFIFNLGYTVKYSESKIERHSSSNNYNSQSGSKNINSMKLLQINLGAKYNLLNLKDNNVSPFAIISLGKRFAFIDNSSEELFPRNNPEIIEDNSQEFLKNLNSPIYLDFGFGAEYSFNRSLTLFTSFIFSYYHVSGTYEYRSVQENYEETLSKDYSASNLETRIGIGLNFYF